MPKLTHLDISKRLKLSIIQSYRQKLVLSHNQLFSALRYLRIIRMASHGIAWHRMQLHRMAWHGMV